MYAFDAFLCKKAQKSCDEIEKVIGLTKFTLEKWILVVLVIVIMMWRASSLLNDFNSIAITISLIAIFVTFVQIYLTGEREKEFLRSGLLHFSICGNASFRITVLILSLSLVFYLLPDVVVFPSTDLVAVLFMILLFVTWVYINNCVPGPPGKSKIRKWYENKLTKMNRKLSAIPVSSR